MEISKQFTQLWVRRWTSKWKVFTVFTRLLMKLKTHQMFSVNVAYCYSLTRFILTQPSWWYLAGSALFLSCKILIGDVWSSFCRRLCCCCHFSWRMCELWCIIIKGSEIKKNTYGWWELMLGTGAFDWTASLLRLCQMWGTVQLSSGRRGSAVGTRPCC